MSNTKRRCPCCKKYNRVEDGVLINNSLFCSIECATSYAYKNKGNGKAKLEKAKREANRLRKKEVKPLKYWQDKLQSLVNQYVMQVRDKGLPCCTCGNPKANECGHWHSRGARPDIRYHLQNLAPQCHACNVYKSGAKAEYNEYIKERWGMDVFNDLNQVGKSLKEQFPHWTDYEEEIARYRKLLRESGVKPRV